MSFLRWTESKMVRMVEEFEKSDQSASVRPWPQRVTFRDPVWPYAQAVFVGLRFQYEKADKVISSPLKDGLWGRVPKHKLLPIQRILSMM